MKKNALLFLLLAVILALGACSGGGGTTTYKNPTLDANGLGTEQDLTPSQDEITTAKSRLTADKGFIGVIACTYSTEYHSTVAQSAEAYAKQQGLSVQTFDPELDVNKQISAIEDFTNSGADVIVICLFDPPSVISALKTAAEQGVYIVQYAGRDVSEFGGVSISIEDADLGQTAGAYAGQLIVDMFGGSAKVAILDYPDLPNVVVRADNIKSALLEKAPNAEIVGNYLGGTTDNGLSSMETALQAYPDINIIASINDAGALGGMKAMEAAGKTDADAAIVGIDAEAQALDDIAANTMYRGTVDTAPARTGEMTIQAAIRMLAGASMKQNYRVPVVLVTRDNISDFVK
jgi:ribose transport system substrate-binding protein